MSHLRPQKAAKDRRSQKGKPRDRGRRRRNRERGELFYMFSSKDKALWPFVNLTDTKVGSSLLEVTHKHG